MLGSVHSNCYKKGKLPPFFRVYVQELSTWLGEKKNSPQEDSIFLLIDIIESFKYSGESEVATKSHFQGPACARQKAHMQTGMAPAGAGPKYLSCQLQLETCLACVCEGVRHSVYVRVEG